jgi:hypothetical protein
MISNEKSLNYKVVDLVKSYKLTDHNPWQLQVAHSGTLPATAMAHDGLPGRGG